MQLMVYISLCLNAVVLVPVCWGLLCDAGWCRAAYGPSSPARGILLALYLVILALSAALLLRPVAWPVATLLLVQIAYKLLTPWTVGTFRNPVVASNLAIAAFHCVTLAALAPRLILPT